MLQATAFLKVLDSLKDHFIFPVGEHDYYQIRLLDENEIGCTAPSNCET